MSKISPLLWIFIILILVLPTAAGRILVDIAGGLMILIFILPLIIGGVGWIVWKILKPKMKTCNQCGVVSLSNNNNCAVCGAELSYINESNKDNSYNSAASETTIDVTAENIK